MRRDSRRSGAVRAGLPLARWWSLVVGALVLWAAGFAVPADAPADPLKAAASRHVVVDGIRVHYKSLGEGKVPLVFIHGWTCDMEFWREQVPAFLGRTRQILIDLPGHGESAGPEVEYTLDLFARAIDAVMEDAGARRGVIVGHSMGTPAALRFYRLFPKRTAAIVAVDGMLRPPPMSRPEDWGKFVAQFEGPGFEDALSKAMDGMFQPGSPAGLREWVKARARRTPQHVAVSAIRSVMTPGLWSEEPIKVPVLAILARSPIWTDEYQASVRKLAPQVEHRFMEGVGHFLMLERPAEFNQILRGFLEEERFLRR